MFLRQQGIAAPSWNRVEADRLTIMGHWRRSITDWNRVEGNWKQVKGKVKEQWSKLTDDDLDLTNGMVMVQRSTYGAQGGGFSSLR
jgi:hypothetical protein